MVFTNVEIESVKDIDTTNWDQQVIIRASINRKVYRYYYVSVIDGGWEVLNRKPHEKATTQQIKLEGVELQNHPTVKVQFLNNNFQ